MNLGYGALFQRALIVVQSVTSNRVRLTADIVYRATDCTSSQDLVRIYLAQWL